MRTQRSFMTVDASLGRRDDPIAPAAADALLYWNPCLGIPVIVVDAPDLYLGVQLIAGLAATLVLLFFG